MKGRIKKIKKQIPAVSLKPKIGEEHKPMSELEQWLILHLGVVLIAVGVYFFKFPNNFAIGGVSGIAVIVNAITPSLSASNINFILNNLLVLLGFFVFGKEFGFKTAYASVLLSVLIEVFSALIPLDNPLSQLPLLELMFAVILPGIGAAMLFNISASSGGTDVIAMILRKYTYVDIGRALLLSDILITLSSFIIFDVQTGLLAIFGLFSKSVIVDNVLESMNESKYFTIITEVPQPIIDFIVTDLHRGGTKLTGYGIYMSRQKTIIQVVVNNYEAVLLKNYTKKIDPNSFVLIINTSQIVGKGFHYIN